MDGRASSLPGGVTRKSHTGRMTEAEFFALVDQARAEAKSRETAYREWVDRRLPELAEELTETLPADLRAAGIRIEWAEER